MFLTTHYMTSEHCDRIPSSMAAIVTVGRPKR